MKRAEIAGRARAGLRNHVDDLGLQRRVYGRRFLLAFRKSVQRIERSPGSIAFYGFDATDLADVRVSTVAGFKNHVIFFRVTSEAVQILRVLHSARDVDAPSDEILPE